MGEKGIARRNQAELKQLLVVADRVASGHVLLTVLDHGAGLFELLDADRDGSLSVPELRRAWDRVRDRGRGVRPGGAAPPGGSDREPRAPGEPARGGPGWFRAMDRNGDGHVSRREFTGEAEVFDKLDPDRDGFISPAEAATAGAPEK